MFDKTWKKVVWGVLVIIVALGCFVRYDFRKFCDESVPIFAYHRVGDYGNIYSMPVKELDAQMNQMDKFSEGDARNSKKTLLYAPSISDCSIDTGTEMYGLARRTSCGTCSSS